MEEALIRRFNDLRDLVKHKFKFSDDDIHVYLYLFILKIIRGILKELFDSRPDLRPIPQPSRIEVFSFFLPIVIPLF